MLLIQFTPANFQTIASAMNNGVSEDELKDMIRDDIEKRQTRWFLHSKDLWAFVEEELLEESLYTVLKLLDS